MLMSHAELDCAVNLTVVRLGGLGLGNHLFTWARFAVATRDYHLLPLAPTWFQIKQGPLRRHERDSRFYNGLFRHPEYISGLRRVSALCRLPRFQEQDLYNGELDHAQSGIVIFRGMGGMFRPFLREHEFLRTELLRMSRPKHLEGVRASDDTAITMHIRCGDFRMPESSDALRAGCLNLRVPTRWFVAVAKRLRDHLGADIPVHVFSDGRPEELADLAELHNCHRCHFGSALADLLAMSKAKVLLMSGSTFGSWAAFLGRMPTICYPGQKHNWIYYDQPDAEIEYLPDAPLPASFVRCLKRRRGASTNASESLYRAGSINW